MTAVLPALPLSPSRDFERYWKPDGSAQDRAPKWAKYRTDMVSEFPSPYRGQRDTLALQIGKFVEKLDGLRSEKGGPAFLGGNGALTYEYPEVKNVAISQEMGDLDQVLNEVVNLFSGAPNWGNPLTMCNVSPQGNTAAIIASMLSQVFAPNLLDGEYSWNVHRAELESAGMLGNLMGWDPLNTGAIYTYGGGGCFTYGVKYGLTRVLPNSRYQGVRTDAKIICSQQAHYAQQNATDWTGLGMDNIIQVRTDVATNQMDLIHLEEILQDLASRNIPVATVICTMGTTDANAFDPIGKVRELLDRFPNPTGFGKAILYADAVVGWSWIYFKDYDFGLNPLGFSKRILPILRKNGQALEELRHADAVGIDFHKVGWAPYVSSCFLYRNAAEFEALHRRGSDSYLQVRTPYNPMYYTLEVSRTASGAMAGWATLKYFGKEGMQAILGGILESKFYLYDLLMDQPDMVCVNPEDSGLVTLFRVYPEGIPAQEQFEKELTQPGHRDDLLKHNRLTEAVGNRLYEWFRQGKLLEGKPTPYLGISTGFRPASYNRDGTDSEAVVFALKSYPMNVAITPEIMQWVLHCVRAACEEVMATGFDAEPRAAASAEIL
ncbi:MAG: pyridoxal-dependent decarboxylase [Holophaga sp.]|nr:pyridoxal-dependent decarboxylase [Holophaga sp.]